MQCQRNRNSAVYPRHFFDGDDNMNGAPAQTPPVDQPDPICVPPLNIVQEAHDAQ